MLYNISDHVILVILVTANCKQLQQIPVLSLCLCLDNWQSAVDTVIDNKKSAVRVSMKNKICYHSRDTNEAFSHLFTLYNVRKPTNVF